MIGMKMRLALKKRNLYLLHRWLGIVLCGFFAMWFVSGVIMLYARMPLLYASERLGGLPPLPLKAVRAAAGDAWRTAGEHGAPSKMRLVTVLGRPCWLLLYKGEKWRGVWADTGEPLGPVTEEQGAEEARRFVRASAPPRHVRTFDGIDQWTFSNSLNLHRPLHRYRFADAEKTEVYVSAVTGEVVNVTTHGQRIGAAVGAYVHWLAPEFLRRQAGLWRGLLLYLSAFGTVLAATGIWVGVLRWRRSGYPNRGGGVAAQSPYRGVMAWHHWSGLLFGAATFAWIFSGLLYMNPGGSRSGPLSTVTTVTPYNEGGIRADNSATPEQTRALSGGPLVPALFTRDPEDARRAIPGLRRGERVKEVELAFVGGRPFYVLHLTWEKSFVTPADEPGAAALPRFGTDELAALAAKGVPDGRPVETALLDEYDGYYYAVGATAPKRLPVLRLKFDDPAKTWLYVNPHNGTIFRRYDTHGRVMRWLVNGLHCLDFPILIKHRPAWDVAVIGLSLGGLALSVSAIVASGRRLRTEARSLRARAAAGGKA